MENPDTGYMKMALELAAKGRGYTSPNPMVGAVIVKNGSIAGRGYHQAAGKPHAEVNAIDDAGAAAAGATMYVTLEPCNHYGRTPPCTQAILAAQISRVVVAMDDPNPGVSGGGADFLRQNGIEVLTGVCEADARKLNAFFIKHTRTGLPYVILKSAATLDGKIATETGDSKWITGTAARRHVHWIRHAVDGILVGVDTVRADNPALTTRLETVDGKDPLRIILDTRLTIPEHASVIKGEQACGTLLVTGRQTEGEKRRKLTDRGVRILEAPVRNERIDPYPLMEALGKMDITSILVEGGSRVSASMLNAGVVDRICFFYAPKILGGDGISICRGPGPEKMASAIQVENIEITRFDDDILIEADVMQ
ncbi:MAG: bifunctional diaminohydroxyphosphoribosylaminopyrimidine deaminase/5-amino-6-(5-phosphoribosylamino)uracil reductase RibD [Thermodesulfobacteriota bacterium]